MSAGNASRLWRLGPLVPVVAAAVFLLAAASSGTSAPPATAAPDGDALYAAHCSSCHGLDGAGVEDRGPSLAPEGRASADFVLRTGRMPLASPDLQARRGPVRFTDAEIEALVATVDRIGDGPDTPAVDIADADVARGGELYRLNCAACHVASAAGAPIGSGRVAPSLMDSTPVQVGQAIVVGPGSMPVFGSFDERDMSDVAAYIDALQRQDTTAPSKFGGAGPAAEGLAAWVLALIPLIAITRWLGRPKEGRDHPIDPAGGTDGTN